MTQVLATRARGWCITDNQPGLLDHDILKPSQVYLVYQLEATEEGFIHYQIYVEYKNAKTFKGVQKDFQYKDGGYCHIEQRRGSRDQARDYCMKEDSRIEGPWEIGTWKEQGRRSDIESLCNYIQSERPTIKRIAKEHPKEFIRYSRGIKDLCNSLEIKQKEKERTVHVWLIQGKPGSGKKTLINLLTKNKDHAFINLSTPEWWDSYEWERYITIVDFTRINKRRMMELCTRTDTIQLPIKGGHKIAKFKHIFLTTAAEEKELINEWPELLRHIDVALVSYDCGFYEWRLRSHILKENIFIERKLLLKHRKNSNISHNKLTNLINMNINNPSVVIGRGSAPAPRGLQPAPSLTSHHFENTPQLSPALARRSVGDPNLTETPATRRDPNEELPESRENIDDFWI